MDIGSRAGSARGSIRAPRFLDKSGGFYGRLDEPEAPGAEAGGTGAETGESGPTEGTAAAEERQDPAGAFGSDDGETLLSRKPSRRSSRWRRSSRRKQKEGRPSPRGEEAGGEAGEAAVGEQKTGGTERRAGPVLVHLTVCEDADDQVLIRDEKRGREVEEEEEEEEEEERKMRRELKEGMKVMKRSTMKTYRKALDRALRRGWEAFIANLYSVTLAPVTSSSSPSPSLKQKHQHNIILAEFQ